MRAPLANTVFSTDIDDQLAAVDVYKETTSSTTDSTGSSSNVDPTELTSFMGMDSSKTSQIEKSLAGEPLPLTSADVSSSVLSSNSALMSNFSSLDKSLQDQLTQVNSNLTTKVDIADVSDADLPLKTITTTSAKNVSAVTGMLDTISQGQTSPTSGLSVHDIAGHVSFLSNLVSLSSKMGIPNAYSKIDAGGFSSDIMGPVTKAAMGVAVVNSDPNLLKNIAFGSMGPNLHGLMPGFVANFVQHFKLPTGTQANSQAQIGMIVNDAFNAIQASWSKTQGSKNTMLNMRIFGAASQEFKQVMAAVSSRTRPPLASTTQSSTIAAAAVPTSSQLPSNVLISNSITDSGQQQVTHYFGNGQQDTYLYNEDGSVSKSSIIPKALTPADLGANFNTSSVDNSLALGLGFDQCLQGNTDIEHDVTPSFSTATSTTLPSASDSIKTNFPLASLGSTPDVDNDW